MSNNELRDQAHEVMLKQSKDNKDPSITDIHAYLCQVTNEEVLAGIIKKGKTIQKAFDYCSDQASKLRVGNSRAVKVNDDVVYGWVEDYYKRDELKPVPKSKKVAKSKDEAQENIKATTENYKKQVAESKPQEKEGSQISLFEL